jgi:broad specificity phosphatase PhoE
VPTTAVYLVRHAQIAENRPTAGGDLRYGAFPDAQLDDTGRRQAEALGQRLALVSFAAAYASPYRRALETAQAILDRQVERPPHLRLTADARWQERDYGQLDGLLASEIARACPPGTEVFYASEDGRPGGAESLRQVRLRGMAALKEVATRHEDRVILLVAHQVVNKVLVCAMLGLNNSRFWYIRQDNACINIFEHNDGVFTAVLINDTCHLRNTHYGLRLT